MGSFFEKLPVAQLVDTVHVFYDTSEYIINSRLHVLMARFFKNQFWYYCNVYVQVAQEVSVPFQFSDYNFDDSIFTRHS